MDNALFHSYKIEERSFAAYIKREIHNLVKPVFNAVRTGEVDIIVSELISNLLKHAKEGELLYRLNSEDDRPVFEIICIDNGPGMADVNYSMRDGISSKNTLGHGLGSITRLSNTAQIYSMPNWGTVVYCRCFASLEDKEIRKDVLIRALNVSMPGEQVSGDGYVMKKTGAGFKFMLGDGLGHGPSAKEAVDAARNVVNSRMEDDPALLIREVHTGVKKTRGLVATIVKYSGVGKKWYMCGVGNISTRLYNGLEFKNYNANNGIVGLNMPSRVENAEFKAERYQQLIMCSDGIKSRWDILKYAYVTKYDPMILAACLYKDNSRRTDDMTVVIIKIL